MKKNSYEKILLREFRKQEFVDSLFQDMDYLCIKFNLISLLIHTNVLSIFNALYFFLQNFKQNIPNGELIYASLFYGIFKVKETKIVYGLYDSNRKSFGLLANSLTDIQFNAQYPAQLVKKNIDRVHPSRARHFVFGENDKQLLIAAGQKEENIVIVGSIYIDIFKKSNFYRSYKKEFDICILSNITHEWVAQNEEKIERKLVQYIEKYKVNNKKLKIVICGRPQAPDHQIAGIKRERAFFKNLIKNYDAKYIKNIPDQYSTYITMLKSEMVIANSSNAAIEAIALDVKTMFYQPYKFFVPAPEEYLFTEKSLDYYDFEKKINKLISISDDEFKTYTKDFKKKYVDNSSGYNLVNYRKSN